MPEGVGRGRHPKLAAAREPSPDAVVVDVRVAGVCSPNQVLIGKQYPLKLEPPFIADTKVAGLVRATPTGSGFVVVKS